jgi:glutaredoxin-related protein
VPALEALQDKFAEAGFALFGISVDSQFCHANWAVSLGGISFPLLQDFHPKGAVAQAYGMYLADAGITDRSTVIMDADGIVRHASSVTPSGERDITELLELCRKVSREHKGKLGERAKPEGLQGEHTLYIKSRCGFSLRTMNARVNLHLENKVQLVNVTEDPAVMDKLRSLTGKEQAPCLVANGKPLLESADIIRYLVTKTTGQWA